MGRLTADLEANHSEPDILSFEQHAGLRNHVIDRSALKKIFVEYDPSEDLINLRLNSTNTINPVEATTLISLLAEALRLRRDALGS